MQFLKTLFWVVVAVLLFYLGVRNWHDVTVNLWGDLQVDIKTPVLMFLMFLVGFLPTYFVLRARNWTLKRRVEALERQLHGDARPAAPVPEPAATATGTTNR